MPIAATCPTCEHSYNVPDGQRGKRVRCRNCADIFVVGGSKGRGRADEDEIDEVVLTDDDAEPAPRKKKAGGGGDGDLRGRLDREDLKPRSRKDKPDRDRDDEDEDDEDRPRRKKSDDGGSSILPLVLGIGGVALLLIIGGGVAIYWATSNAVTTAENVGNNLANKIQKGIQGVNPVLNPGNNPGVNPGPAPRSHFQPPANINEALEDMRDHFNDPFMPKARAEWLASQPVVETRRKEVCDALWNASQNSPHHFVKESATVAFCKWAGPGQSEQLLKLVEAGRGEAMEAAVRNKTPGVAAALSKRLTDWGSRGGVVRHLEALGGATAEKDVIKYLNHPDGDLRNTVNGLLKKWGTKPDVIVDQILLDLGNINLETVRAALERLNELSPTGSTKQPAVVKGIKPLMLNTNHDVARLSTQAATLWGGTEMIPDLIVALDTPGHPFDRNRLMQTLAKHNTDACRQAIVRQLVTGNGFQVSQLIRQSGGAPYEAPLGELLQSTKDQRVRRDVVMLLKDFGTPASVPALQAGVPADDRLSRFMADNAIKEIQARAQKK